MVVSFSYVTPGPLEACGPGTSPLLPPTSVALFVLDTLLLLFSTTQKLKHSGSGRFLSR